MIRSATPDDGEALAEIYNYYIKNTIITFEEEIVDSREMASRLADIHAADLPWFVAVSDGQVCGYVYASKWKGRCAYRHSVESSVYLAHNVTGKGIGTALYQHLLDELEDNAIHVVIGGAALPNAASVALHEKLGFAKVAHFKEVGRKFGQWIDVGYWQRTLSHTSNQD